MEYLFIINPASGKSNTKEGLGERILECAKRRGIEAELKYTERAGDVGDFIAEFARVNPNEDIKVYVCGGDGTLCEAVNGIMKAEDRGRISLGVLPVGTGNDFVRNFGEKELFLDIDAQLDAKKRRIDILRCNEIYAVNMINIGFDCQVVVRTATIKKRKLVPSRLAYICGLALTLIKKPGTRMTLIADGGEQAEKKLLLSTFANGGYCGGGFHSNPESSLDDGMVNALFINNIPRRRFVRIVDKYKKGLHLSGEYADILSSEKAVSYQLSFDAPTEVSIDGEIMVMDKADIECIGGAIDFLVPSGVGA